MEGNRTTTSLASEESLFQNWQKALGLIQKELSERSFETWFGAVRCLAFGPQEIVLGVPDPFYGNWLEEIMKTRKISRQGLQSIKEALTCSGCIERAYATATQCICNAKACLDKIPGSPYRSVLIHLADSILQRKN